MDESPPVKNHKNKNASQLMSRPVLMNIDGLNCIYFVLRLNLFKIW